MVTMASSFLRLGEGARSFLTSALLVAAVSLLAAPPGVSGCCGTAYKCVNLRYDYTEYRQVSVDTLNYMRYTRGNSEYAQYIYCCRDQLRHSQTTEDCCMTKDGKEVFLPAGQCPEYPAAEQAILATGGPNEPQYIKYPQGWAQSQQPSTAPPPQATPTPSPTTAMPEPSTKPTAVTTPSPLPTSTPSPSTNRPTTRSPATATVAPLPSTAANITAQTAAPTATTVTPTEEGQDNGSSLTAQPNDDTGLPSSQPIPSSNAPVLRVQNWGGMVALLLTAMCLLR